MPYDPRFSFFQTSTLAGVHSPVRRTGPSVDAVYAQWQQDVTRAEHLAGRPLTDAELRKGIAKADPRSERDKMRSEFARRRELNPPQPAKSPEQLRLESARQRADEERREKLTNAQRELEDATAAHQAAEERAARQAEASKIRSTAQYQGLRERLDELLFVSRFDASVSPEIVEHLQHQSDLLERFLDVATTHSNLDAIQRAARAGLDVEAARLKAQTDAVAMRQKLMSAGAVFDSVTTETVGNLSFVALTANGQTVKVSHERYNNRVSDEALRNELFNGGAE